MISLINFPYGISGELFPYNGLLPVFLGALLLGAIFFIICRRQAHLSSKEKIFCLACGFGVIWFPHQFDPSILTAIGLIVGLTLVSQNKSWAGWTIVALGTALIPENLFALFLLSTFLYFKRNVKLPFASLALAATLYFFIFTPFHTQSPSSTYPFFFGLLAILLSFGKGLLFFAPGFFLFLIWRKRLDIQFLFVLDGLSVFTAGLILAYSASQKWAADTTAPQIFILACIPAAIILGLSLSNTHKKIWRNILLLLVTTMSFYAAAISMIFNFSQSPPCNTGDFGFLCLYAPEFSPLWRPFVQMPELKTAQIIALIFMTILYLLMTALTWKIFFQRLIRRMQFAGKTLILAKGKWQF